MFSAVLKLLAILAVSGAFALWIDHRSATVLPQPSGAYPVGRSIQDWRESDHELLAWIWYPAAAPSSVPDDYLPAYVRAAYNRNDNPIFRLLERDRAKVHGHSIRDAAISPRQPSFPVVIFRGGASAEVSGYSVLVEDLASHGYIVVGMDAPGRTGIVAFPDGRVVTRLDQNNVEFCQAGGEVESACVDDLLHSWTADIAFAVDHLTTRGPFTGHLDLTNLGVFGHSFGGAQAAEFCHDDPRCKAAIDIDGLVFANFAREAAHQPFMFLFSDQINSTSAEARQVRAQLDAVYERLPQATRSRFFIRGSNHFLFSDEPSFIDSHIVMRTLRGLGVLGIDGPRQLAATAYLVRTFFDVHLKNQDPSLLRNASALYPEIRGLP